MGDSFEDAFGSLGFENSETLRFKRGVIRKSRFLDCGYGDLVFGKSVGEVFKFTNFEKRVSIEGSEEIPLCVADFGKRRWTGFARDFRRL